VALTTIGLKQVVGIPIAFKSGQRALSHRNAVLSFEEWEATLKNFVEFLIEHDSFKVGGVEVGGREESLNEILRFLENGVAEVTLVTPFQSRTTRWIDSFSFRAFERVWKDSKKRKGGLVIPARFSRSPKKNFISLRVPHR